MELYGRLDIYWPDGPIESFPLEKPEIAVGRQSGNDIVLDTTTVSRYHVRISHQDGQVFVTDLDTVNGTYVDGARLLPNEPRLLKGSEEIQIGDLRAVYQPTLSDEMPTAVAEQERTVPTSDLLGPKRTFSVHLESAMLTVTPGAHNQIHIDIQNLSDSEKNYTLTIEGAPNGWARFDRSRITLDPTERASIALLVKPIRRSDSLPGDYPLIIHVQESNSDQEVAQPLLLRVRNFSGFGIAFNSPQAAADGHFEIYIHNQGNAPLSVQFVGADPANKFAITLTPPSVTLPPGERSLVRGQIRLRQRNWALRPQTFSFDVIAQAQDDSHFQTPIAGTYEVIPQLTTWGIPIIAPVAIGAIVLALLASCATLALGTILRSPASATPIASPTVAVEPLTPFTAVPLNPPGTLATQNGTPPTDVPLPTLILPTSGTLFALPTTVATNPPGMSPDVSPSPSIGG